MTVYKSSVPSPSKLRANPCDEDFRVNRIDRTLNMEFTERMGRGWFIFFLGFLDLGKQIKKRINVVPLQLI